MDSLPRPKTGVLLGQVRRLAAKAQEYAETEPTASMVFARRAVETMLLDLLRQRDTETPKNSTLESLREKLPTRRNGKAMQSNLTTIQNHLHLTIPLAPFCRATYNAIGSPTEGGE